MAKVQILLATYNGEAFLERQLNSISAQTYQDWEILARDDGSSDRTVEILEDFARRKPGKLTLVKDDRGNLGSNTSFLELMEKSTADIVCWADQDDVWHRDKVERSVQAIEEMEAEHGVDTPLLVHHDIQMINENGDLLSTSFARENNVDKADNRLSHILLQNVFTGFTLTVNRALVERATPAPKGTTSLDAHLGMFASVFGHVKYIEDPLANYRIHDNNVCGGKNIFYNISRDDFTFRNFFNGHAFGTIRDAAFTSRAVLLRKCERAAAFLSGYGEDMPEDTRRMCEDFTKLSSSGPFTRRRILLRHGFFPTSSKLKAALLVFG